VEHNKASENCFIAAIASGDAVLMVVVLGCCYGAVPQNALDHRVIHAKAVQIRCQAPAESMPSVPQDSSTLKHVFHFPLIVSIQVERVSDSVCKDQATRGFATSLPMGVKPLGELWNDRHWGF
jgi:hypothetical protein